MDTDVDVSQIPSVPVMARKKFAEMVGVDEGVVQGWISRGYLPVLEIGRWRLVNLALLNKIALEKDFRL